MEEDKKELLIDDLEFSNRVKTLMHGLGITKVSELVNYTAGTLRAQRLCGDKIIDEIRSRLSFHGLCLNGDIIVQSSMGIKMAKEIPEILDRLKDKLNGVKRDVDEISRLIDKIQLCEKTRI